MAQNSHFQRGAAWQATREMVIFAMLGAIMYVSKLLMEWAPNVHFIGMLTVTYTLVYRKKALIPVYVFVFLTGLFNGFNVWWVPYLYLWPILWAAVMLLPKNMHPLAAFIVYDLVCSLHGLAYGTLYAPFQALAFGYSLQATLTWIATGFPWDIVHALGNMAAGVLIIPMSSLLFRLEKKPLPRWALSKHARISKAENTISDTSPASEAGNQKDNMEDADNGSQTNQTQK